MSVAGGPLTDDEFNAQAQADVQRAELLTTPVVLLLLLLIFGGLLAAGLPLLVAVAGVGGTFGILYAFSLVGDVSVYAIQVATMLSVGLAVDYGLLMVSRFREERAVAPGRRRARSPVPAPPPGAPCVYSGLTVAAVLAGLLVFPDPFLRSMGLAGIAVVTVVVAAALTLLPALLTLVGHRIAAGQAGAGSGARSPASPGRSSAVPLVTALAASRRHARCSPGRCSACGSARSTPGCCPTSTQTRQLHDAIATHYPELDRPGPVVIVAAAPRRQPGHGGPARAHRRRAARDRRGDQSGRAAHRPAGRPRPARRTAPPPATRSRRSGPYQPRSRWPSPVTPPCSSTTRPCSPTGSRTR